LNRFAPAAIVLLLATSAHALVEGERHALYQRHRVFGGAAVTGNTLMTASIAAPEVNSGLLPRSAGDVDSLPFDARLEGAYLFWSGSIANRVDRDVDLTAADGTLFDDIAADRCVTVQALGGSFYCRADVTARLRDHPGARAFNGTYFVGDVDAEPGFLNPDGTCQDERECQGKFAGWSLVLVYTAESANTLRDVFLHDGFRHLDETPRSAGIDRFTIRGFDFPAGGSASLSYFALEGDSFLGVPPQDTDPVFPCATCFDYLRFNGTKLSNAFNPPNNLFNSSSPNGYTLGLDLDSFNVSNNLDVGDQQVVLEAGSGDGVVEPGGPEPSGAGEAFFLGYVLLVVDRNAPNFSRGGTVLSVVPDEAAPAEVVVVTLRLENEGTRDAPNTRVTLRLPNGLSYVADSLRVDGEPVPGAQNPLRNGRNVGNVPFRGDNSVVLTFRARVDVGVAAGTRLRLRGSINADTLEMEVPTNEAVITVQGALDLGQVTKRVSDTSGDGRYTPDEVIQYEIFVPNPNDRDVVGVSLTDQLPPYLDLVRAITFSGEDRSDPARNLVRIDDMVVPGGGVGGTSVTVIARIHSTDQLLRDGVGAGELDGFPVSNRATVVAAGVEHRSDDPTTAAPGDATTFELAAEVDITGPQTRKTAADVNGEFLEPGDRIRYRIFVGNGGATPADVVLTDALPEHTEDCQLESAQPDLLCGVDRLQGFLTVPPGEVIEVIFTVRVAADTPHTTVIGNVANVRAVADPNQNLQLESERLRVVFAPVLGDATKVATNAPGGVVTPGQTVRYELRVPNTGNRVATGVSVIDVIPPEFAAVRPEAGGVTADGRVTWNVGEIAPGDTAVLAFEADLPPGVADGTLVRNQGEVVAAELNGATLTDDPATGPDDDPTVLRVRSQPLLTMTKDAAPRDPRPGDTVTYTLTLRNGGTDATRGAVLRDRLPEGAFASVVPEGGRLEGGAVVFDGFELDVGAERVFTVRAELAPVLQNGLEIPNQAQADADNADGTAPSDDPSTPEPNDPTVVRVQATPAIAITKRVIDLNGGDVQPGDRLRYDLRVASIGDAPVIGFTLTDTLHAALVDIAPSDGGVLEGRTIVWRPAAPLVPGAPPLDVSFAATVAAGTANGTVVDNQASGGADDIPLALSDDPDSPAPGDPTVFTVVSRPELGTSTKDVEPREAAPGDLVTWTITVANTGTGEATDVQVTDAVPAELEDVQVEGGGVADGVARWDVPVIAAGAGAELRFTARVRAGTANGTVVRNQAQVAARDLAAVGTDDPQSPEPGDDTELVVRAFPRLTVTKAVSDPNGAPARPGDELVYTIVVVNDGHDVARELRLVDELTEALELVDAAGAEVDGDQIIWRPGDLAPGERFEVALRVRLRPMLQNGLIVSNRALAQAAGDIRALSDDPATAIEGDLTSVQVISAADLSGVTKTVVAPDGELRPGARVVYTITIPNDGDDAAQNVLVRDPVPAELVEPRGGTRIVDGVVEFDVGAVLPGERRVVSFEATIGAPLDNGTIVSNRAAVFTDGAAAPFLTDDPRTPEVDATRFTVVSEARSTLTKTVRTRAGGRFSPGAEVVYTLTLGNSGTAISRGVEVTDTFPAGLLEIRGPEAVEVEDALVRWAAPDVAPGETASVEISATIGPEVAGGTRIENQAAAGELRSDDPALPGDADPTAFEVVDEPDLTGLTKSVVGAFEPGEVVTYTILASNRGSADASGVEITDVLPGELELVGTRPPAVVDEQRLSWDLGDLPAGRRVPLTVVARIREGVPDATVVSNVATAMRDGLEAPGVVSDDPTTVDVDDDATRFTVVARPALTVAKAVRDDNGGDFNPGDPVTWLLTVTNEGNREARDVEVTDPVDRNLRGLRAPGAEFVDRVAIWSIEAIAPGASVELEVRARIRADADDGLVIANQFGARVGPEGDFTQSERIEIVVRLGRLRNSTKSVRTVAPGGRFVAGAEIEYTIVVRNDGDTPVADVSVIDPMDRGRLRDIAPRDGGVLDGQRGVVEWTPERNRSLRLIPPGQAVSLRVRATISPALQPGEPIGNQATVAARGDPAPQVTDDPDTDEEDDPTLLVVVGGPAYTITKARVAPIGIVQAGDAVTYEILVRNDGSAPAIAPVLTDNLPGSVRYRDGSTTLNGVPVRDLGGAPPFGRGLSLGEQLEVGERAVVRFQVLVRPRTPVGTRVENRAFVRDADGGEARSDDPDTPGVPDDATVFVVGGVPDLTSFLKTYEVLGGDGTGRAVVGQTIEWRLVVTNRGGVSATNARISDDLPSRSRYIPESMRLDERGLTDVADRDPGRAADGRIEVELGDIAPGQSVTLTYQTEVERGPTVENLATVFADGGIRERSDDDGDEANGNQPTIVPVGDAPVRRVTIVKQVEDPTGGDALVGEPLIYTLSLLNLGTVDLIDLQVTDSLPPGLVFDRNVDLPQSAVFDPQPAPAGDFQNGELVYNGVSVAAGEQVDIRVSLRVDPRLEEDRNVCNTASVTGPGVPLSEAPPVCVAAKVVFGDLAGATFQDVDRDGGFDSGGEDIPFVGMRVGLYALEDPDGEAIAEATTDEAGGFAFRQLRPGDFKLRVFSATNVLLMSRERVQVTANRINELPLAIDPSGRVHDSQSGDLIDGAEVFVYHADGIEADDLFTESGRQGWRLVAPEDLEAASQQGQRTAHGGLYQFAVKRPGRYVVEVLPPGVGFVSPSELVPPAPGLAFTDLPDGRVVANDLPSVAPDADRTYFMAFDLRGPDDEFFNNHIPIDPLSSLISVTKRARQRTATVGEVVTYEIDVVNQSRSTDLLFDPVTGTGGVVLQDILPKGFKYLAGSGTWVRVQGGREAPLHTYDPSADQARILDFQRFAQQDGETRRVAMDLHAGEALRLRYQAVVGANVRPRESYTNYATLLSDSIPVSDTAEAKVRVMADPDFDQGLLLGRVFCDDDGDGRQTEGETGAPGARVYLDNGTYAVSDTAGKFHFKDIDPGTHALKVDAGTLLPGAEFTTDEVRVVSFTRGLPAKVDFGVTCPSEKIEGAVLELGEEGLAAALAGLRDRYVVVSGHIPSLSVRVGAREEHAAALAVDLVLDGKSVNGRDLKPRAGGVTGELGFRTRVGPGAPRSSWVLWVGPMGGEEVEIARGRGAPPSEIAWNQKDLRGHRVLKRGRAYTYRLEVAGDDGHRIGSPAGLFGAGASAAKRPPLIAAFPTDGFRGARSLGGVARKAIDEVSEKLGALDGRILVEVYTDDRRPDAESRPLTQARAEAIKRYLEEKHGISGDRIDARGLANDRPIVPNISERNQRRNRRVEIRHKPPRTDEAGPAKLDLEASFPAVARVGADEVGPESSGEFAMVARIPEDGVVEVLLRAADGRRAVFPVGVRPGSAAARDAPRQVVVEGKLPDELLVAGEVVPVRGVEARVTGPEMVDVEAGKLAEPVKFTLRAPGKAVLWRFVVTDAADEVVFETGGDGQPPTDVAWGGPEGARPGVYSYRLTTRTKAGVIAQSNRGQLRLGKLVAVPELPAGEAWGLRLDGQPVAPDPSGRFYAPITVQGREALLVEVTRPDGGRGVFFVTPKYAPAPAGSGGLAPAAFQRLEPRARPTGGDGRYDKLGPTGPLVAQGEGAGDRGLALPETPTPPKRRPLPLSERQKMDAFGRAELMRLLAPIASEQDANVPARKLAVQLPKANSTLNGRSLPIRGTTASGNRVYLNGAEVKVDPEGRFAGVATLPAGSDSAVEVRAVDTQGNRAVIRHPVQVPDSGWFLLAMAEGLAGSVDTELDGVEARTSTTLGDSVYVHGRARAYFKGYMSGDEVLGGLFSKYEATGHLDSARRQEFETYFRQLVDPERFYPVYGDSAQEVNDVNTRGPIYVAIKADDSTLTVGNFKSEIRGLELLNYDRALYGAHTSIDVKRGDLRHELRAFASDQQQPERHAYVELRGTGGSLYYLPHREVVEGSERVFLVERDRISGIERRRLPLGRDADYSVRYLEGRILAKSPVPMVTLDRWGPQVEPTDGSVLEGHPVFLAVEYDHRDDRGAGETAYGVHARETWKDTVTVGGGYIREGRPGGDDYQLYGGELRLKHGRRSGLDLELAKSTASNGENLFSDDGGLTFRPFNRRDALGAEGGSFLLRGRVELDDFAGEAKRDHWYSEGYWQYVAPGFYSGGSIQQQALEKFGVKSRYIVDEHHSLRIQHDGLASEQPENQTAASFSRAFRREVTRAGYGFVDGPLKLDVELQHTQEDPGGNDEVFQITSTSVGGSYALDERWTALFEQEFVLRGDARVHQEAMDLLTSTAGLRYRIDEMLSVEATESVRWSGDNATQIGFRTQLDERHTAYVQERLDNRDGRTTSTTVVGGEELLGADKSGRAYGEYQLETGSLGERNRAVLGVGKRARIIPGLTLDAGYEHSQVLGGSAGEFSVDAVSLGVEWLDSDKLKVTGRFEIRYEDNDEDFDRRDRVQFLSLNAGSFKLHRDVTALTRFNFAHTIDLGLDATEAELIEMSLGLAYRPVHSDWIALVLKYTKRYEQRPLDLLTQDPERYEYDVVSLIPILELGYNLQLVEKVALKRQGVRVAQLPTAISQSVLWINRLNYHLTRTVDAGLEYRMLRTSLAQSTLQGVLAEANYIIDNKVRLGLGYNFTSFSDDEFARLDEDHGGPFFRVVGQY